MGACTPVPVGSEAALAVLHQPSLPRARRPRVRRPRNLQHEGGCQPESESWLKLAASPRLRGGGRVDLHALGCGHVRPTANRGGPSDRLRRRRTTPADSRHLPVHAAYSNSSRHRISAAVARAYTARSRSAKPCSSRRRVRSGRRSGSRGSRVAHAARCGVRAARPDTARHAATAESHGGRSRLWAS